MRSPAPGLALVLCLLCGCGTDAEQRRVCESLLFAFEPYPRSVQILAVETDPTLPGEVTLQYLSRAADRRVGKHWITCGFRGSVFGGERFRLVKVATDRRGVLNATQLQMLAIWQRLMSGRLARADDLAAAPPGAPVHSPLYFAQQLVNAIVPCSVYALLAVGFSLVHGLVGRINFAFGDIATFAGMTLYLGVTLSAGIGADDAPWAFAMALAAGIAVAAAWGLASERVVFRPLAGADGQAALIAAIGLAMAMREGLRLAQGSRDFWLSPIVSGTWVLARDGEAAVSVSGQQLALLAAAGITCGAIVLLLRLSRFGRRYRACCQDRRMAALLGIDPSPVTALTFALAGAAAGIAGLMVTAYYGTTSAYMGMMLGFKALVAAIAGGLGSIPGAVVGGLLVGLLEQMWSGYLPFGYRDLAVFGLLSAVLVFRPNGLLGRTRGITDRP